MRASYNAQKGLGPMAKRVSSGFDWLVYIPLTNDWDLPYFFSFLFSLLVFYF
jgi:hypothetical protein